MEEKKKEETKSAKSPGEVEANLDYLILDYPKSKYEAIPLAAEWVKALRRREENRHLTPSELLDLAMRDVLSGRISWKDVNQTSAEAEAPDTALNGAGKASTN